MIDIHRKALVYNGTHFYFMRGNPQLLPRPHIKGLVYDMEFSYLPILWLIRWGGMGIQPMSLLSSYMRMYSRPMWKIEEA